MNILLPILSNLIVLTLILVGIFKGKKNGISLELLKLILCAGILVGNYFLTPVLFNLLTSINVVGELVSASESIYGAIYCGLFAVVFSIIYGIVSLILDLIGKHKRFDKLGMNSLKPAKIKGVNRKETRRLRREQRKLRKFEENKPCKCSQVFGAIIGFLLAIVIGYVLLCPVRHITDEYKDYKSAYEYTIYGQFDKIVDVSNFIIKK